jgi:thiol-disulfide isomerase/thioredoxin
MSYPRRYLWILTLLILIVTLLGAKGTFASDTKLEILFFWGEGCPHCEKQKPYMKELTTKYPAVVVRDYEVYNSRENQTLLGETKEKYGITARGIPMTFIGERHWVGWQNQYYAEMTAEVERLLGISDAPEVKKQAAEVIRIPWLGDVNTGKMPLIVATAFIAFVDGFNPCSLWLLTVLLGILLYTRSRKKIIIVGLSFLLTTAAGYGAFILGLFNFFMYVGYLDWIKIAVGFLALIFAAVNIKDYFWFKEGVSFSISDKHKPGIFKRMRTVISPDMSTAGMVGATIVMALGVTLVELPCTAGFPVVWTNIVVAQQIGTLEFALLFALYLLIYLGIEITILAVAVVTLHKSVFEEKHGRILKLISGVIMLSLAYGIVFDYKALESIAGIMRLFGIAALIIILVLLLHRVVLPYFGVTFGSEEIDAGKRSIGKPSDKK